MRLWAVGSLYLTNKFSLGAFIWLIWMVLNFSFLGTNVGQNSKLQQEQSAIQNAEVGLESIKKVEVGIAHHGFRSEKEKSHRISNAEQRLIQAKQAYREAKERNRKKFLNVYSLLILIMAVCALGTLFERQFRSQFFNSRLTMIPGFLVPHLLVGFGVIVLNLAVVSVFMQYWCGASFWAYFSLAVSSAGIVIYVITFSTRLLGLLIYPVIAAFFLNHYISSEFFGNYLDGQYPVLTAGLLLFALFMLVLNIRSLIRLTEEDLDYSTSASWDEYFERIKSRFRNQSLKDSSGNMTWFSPTNDWLFCRFFVRSSNNTQWKRAWLWQASRGGQAVIFLGIFICVAIVAAITIVSGHHILSERQLLRFFIPMVLIGLVLFSKVLLFSWVPHISKFGSELIRPMGRIDFVKSLILTHLFEASILAVPVWLGSILLFWIYYPEQSYVASILSICCAVIYVCLFPWIISFRSMTAVHSFFGIVFFGIVFFSIVFPVIMPLSAILGIQRIDLSFWQQCLALACSLCIGLLLLADTKRRWMNTEFGR